MKSLADIAFLIRSLDEEEELNEFDKRVREKFGVKLIPEWTSGRTIRWLETFLGIDPFSYYRYRKWRKDVVGQICHTLLRVAERYGPVISDPERDKKVFKNASARAEHFQKEFAKRWKAIKRQADAEDTKFDPANTRKVAQSIVAKLDAECRIITRQNDDGEFMREREPLPGALEQLRAYLTERVIPLAPELTLPQFNNMFRGIDDEMSAIGVLGVLDWLAFKNRPSDHELYMDFVAEFPGLRLAPYDTTVSAAKLHYALEREEREFDAFEEIEVHLEREMEKVPEAQERASRLLAKVKAAAQFDFVENVRGSPELCAELRTTYEDFNKVIASRFETPTAKHIWRIERDGLFDVTFEDVGSVSEIVRFAFNTPPAQAIRDLRKLVCHHTFRAIVAGHISHVAREAISCWSTRFVIDVGKFEHALGLDDPGSERFQSTREALRLAHEDPASNEAMEEMNELINVVKGIGAAFRAIGLGKVDVVEFVVPITYTFNSERAASEVPPVKRILPSYTPNE